MKDQTGQRLIRVRFTVGLLLGIVALSAGAWKLSTRREPLILLQQRAAQAGVVLDFGTVERGWFSATARQARLRIGDGISISAESLRCTAPLFGEEAVVFDGVHFTFRGSPTTLFQELTNISQWQGLRVDFNHVSADFECRPFGRITLKDVSVERSGSGYRVRAGELSLGPKRWPSVTLSIEKPKTALTIGIGEQVSAPLGVRYIPTPGVASEWVFDIASQPLALLSKRLGIDPGVQFDASRIVGNISTIVPDDPQRKIRGNLAVLVDGCPRPSWPDSMALIGATGSLAARIEPAADRSSWALPHVEVTLPLFSLTGTGKITFGEHSRFAIDVSGMRDCAQLRAHLPPSSYLELVKSHIETNSANRAVGPSRDPAAESAELRLQMDLDDSPLGRRNVAWHLSSGCGLKELSEGTFADLELPRTRVHR